MPDEQTRSYLATILTNIHAYIDDATNVSELNQKIVNAPFLDKLYATSLDLGIVVLLRVNEHEKMIDRIALSDTSLAREAVRASAKPFKEIRIPLEAKGNIIAEAIAEHRSFATEDWQSLFTPVLTSSEARRNQTSAGIECSVVYPLDTVPSGALIFSFYQPELNLTQAHQDFIVAFTDMVSARLRDFLQ